MTMFYIVICFCCGLTLTIVFTLTGRAAPVVIATICALALIFVGVVGQIPVITQMGIATLSAPLFILVLAYAEVT